MLEEHRFALSDAEPVKSGEARWGRI